MIPDEISVAVGILSQSSRGRNAMRHALAWLDDDGLGLDQRSQEAVLALLDAAWGSYAGSVRDAMRDSLPTVETNRVDPQSLPLERRV